METDEYPVIGSFTVKIINDGDSCGAVIDGKSISAFSDTIGKALHEFAEVLQLVASDEKDAAWLVDYKAHPKEV